jgi:hypothetical protein
VANHGNATQAASKLKARPTRTRSLLAMRKSVIA